MICISWSFGGPARMRPKSAQNLSVAGNAHFRLALDPNCQETPVVETCEFPGLCAGFPARPSRRVVLFLGVPLSAGLRGVKDVSISCARQIADKPHVGMGHHVPLVPRSFYWFP